MPDDTTTSENPLKPKGGSGGKWYKEMIGPLPAAAWIAVVGGALGYSYYKKRHGVSTVTPTATDATLPMTDATIGNLGGGGGGQPTGPPTATITDNQQWYRQALAVMVGRGFDPALVDRALRDYLQGNQLDAAEQQVIDIALQLVGPAPAPPPPAPPTPPITQPPTGPPTPQPTGGPPTNLAGLDNHTLLSTGNFLLEQNMGDPRPYAEEAKRRMQAGTLSSNDPFWDMVPSFKAYTTRFFFGFLKEAA